MSFQKRTGNPFTRKKWLPVREEPVATKQKKQLIHTTIIFILDDYYAVDQRKWNDIPDVEYVDEGSLSFSVSKAMTRILWHRGLHREKDGAMEWNRWSPLLRLCLTDAPRWTNQMWMDNLHRRSNKNTCQWPEL